jgi:hypothetical protein
MAFDSYPDDNDVLDLPPQQSAQRPITTLRFDPNRFMHLRVVQIAAGGAAPPTLALKADDGPMTVVAQTGTPTQLPGATGLTVANAVFTDEQNGVYRIRVSKGATSPLQKMALQLTNDDTTATRSFRWVVADSEPETRQPRVVFSPTHLDVVTDHLEPREIAVRNIGTGELHITAPADPALGSGFALDGAPSPVPPNSTGVLTVRYTPPSLPPGGIAAASTTYRFTTDDTIAERPERRDAYATITATVRAPQWQAGDVLVVDSQANDGGGRGALIRIDPSSGRQTVLCAGAPFSSPAGVALEASGNALVADPSAGDGNGAVIRVDRVTGDRTVLSPTLPAGNLFRDPTAVVVTPQGRIVVADPNAFSGVGGLIAVDPDRGEQTTLASGNPLQKPVDLAVDDPATGFLVALNDVSAAGPQVVRIGSDGVGAGFSTDLRHLGGIAIDETRRVLVLSRLSVDGPIALVAYRPDGNRNVVSEAKLLGNPRRLCRDGTGDVLVTDWVVPGQRGRLIRIRPSDGQQSLLSDGGVLRAPLDLVVVPSPSEDVG